MSFSTACSRNSLHSKNGRQPRGCLFCYARRRNVQCVLEVPVEGDRCATGRDSLPVERVMCYGKLSGGGGACCRFGAKTEYFYYFYKK